MSLIARFALWLSAGIVSLLADILTKAAPHPLVVNNYSHPPPIALLLVGGVLCILGLHSPLLAVGAGLMFGGLCGNGGQIVLYGYVSDWIPVAGWRTNIADISGAVGLLFCFVGYTKSLVANR